MYEQPNFTQTPNLFFDEHLKGISKMSELKVTLVILRQTFGYHEKQVQLTIPDIIGHTGLSRPSVIEGIGLAIDRGTIRRRKEGRTFIYEPAIGTVKNFNRKQSRPVKNFEQKVDCSAEEALISEIKKESNTSPTPPKNKIEELEYAIGEVEDPDSIPGARNELSVYDVDYGVVYANWYGKYLPRGGIGRKGAKHSAQVYMASLHAYFKVWESNSQNGRRNGRQPETQNLRNIRESLEYLNTGVLPEGNGRSDHQSEALLLAARLTPDRVGGRG